MTAGPQRFHGWLAIPAFLVVLALVGIAISTESRDEFEQRTATDQLDTPQPGRQQPGQGDPQPGGSAGSGEDTTTQPVPEPADGEPAEGGETEGQSITLGTADGEIIIQLDEDGRLVQLTPVEGAVPGQNGVPGSDTAPGTETENDQDGIDPPSGGVDSADVIDIDPEDLVAIRVNEDGSFEVVPLDQISPDDTVLVPSDDGFDLVRPDGSRVEFRADGENDGITATEVAPDGTETELTPNPDGTVTLSDGTTVGPIDLAEDGGPIERFLDRTSDLPWPWVVGGLVLLALLSIGTALYLHRNRPNDPFDLSQFAVEGISVDSFEDLLRSLAADQDQDRAIRVAFYTAERGLAGLPPRRPTETPFEWHHRVSEERPDLAAALAPICDRFALVRFAPGHATSEDRDTVVAQLRALHQAGADSGNAAASTMAGAR